MFHFQGPSTFGFMILLEFNGLIHISPLITQWYDLDQWTFIIYIVTIYTEANHAMSLWTQKDMQEAIANMATTVC